MKQHLNPCRACGKMIAKTAGVCPHCGASLTSWRRILIGLVVALLFVAVMIFFQVG